jgi:S1-C subfamily serine protease
MTVSLYDESSYDAVLVGMDEENDLAVIKIPTGRFREADADYVRHFRRLAGRAEVVAIGNPFGYDRTMTVGIVSGLGRPVRSDNGKVHHGDDPDRRRDQSGNSGGPLLNSRGEMIGINTSIYSTSGGSMGISFSIPVDTAVAGDSRPDQVRQGFSGWLDIVPVQLSSQIVEYAKLPVEKGILVSQVVPGGKADKSGLKGGSEKVRYGNSVIYLGGDVIVGINGTPISEYKRSVIRRCLPPVPATRSKMTVNRGGTEKTLQVELVERTSENVGWIVR